MIFMTLARHLGSLTGTFTHLFTPHHTNNHRPRLLHPAGLAVLVGIILLTHSSLELLALAPPQGFVLGYASNISDGQILESINNERAKIGLKPLKLNSSLSQAARAKATHMFANDYWAHISPQGTTPWEFIKSTGYRYSVAGENLARDFDTTQPMIQAWMDSPTHKANIVHQRYEDTGLAVVNGSLDGIETTLVVQMFGAPTGVIAAAPAPTPAPTISPEASVATEVPALEPEPEPVVARQETVLAESIPAPTLTASPKTYISPLQIKTSVALAIIIMLVAVIAVDEFLVRKRHTLRFVGRNLAHISFLGLVVLLIITLSVPGGIL
jgi:hypothetical protein